MRSAACTVAAGSPCAKYSWVSRSSASSAHGERPNSTTTRCRFVAAVEASAASIADVYSASGYAESAGESAASKRRTTRRGLGVRSEEHTSKLQSPYDLVCRLLLEKKKTTTNKTRHHQHHVP